MVSINTNLSSLIVQQNLTNSTKALNQAIERLTTGYKINHASDNAANYSIANNMTSQLSSYEIAQDNVSMGMDMVQTAMDSMNLIQNHLSRIRDLAEQASNGTYGQDSINAINQEVQARLEEINRIVANTEFNDIQLLEGEKGESNVTGYFLKPVNQLTEEEAIAQGYTVIKTKADLENIKNNMSGKYILMNDIDLENSCLSYSTGDPGNIMTFEGELNGNGYIIKNLSANAYAVGLFAEGNGATVQNLGLENINIPGAHHGAGFFAGGTNCQVNNIYVTGNAASTRAIGGLLGEMTGNNNIIDSYSNVTISSSHSSICYDSNDVTCTNVYWNTDKTTNPVSGSSTLVGATGVTTEELAALVIDPSEQGCEVAKNIQLQVGINGGESSRIGLSLGGLGLSGLSINISSNTDAQNALSTIDGYLSTISAKQTEFGAVYNQL